MEVSLGDALQRFLRSSRLGGSLRAVQVEDAWEEMMGPTISKYTERIEIINRTLFISTHVAPLKNELLFHKSLIIQRVNEALGEEIIQEVVIR